MNLGAMEGAFAGHMNQGPRRRPPNPITWGVVQSVNAGPPKTVTVTVNGGVVTTIVRYGNWYSPAVNDVVALIRDSKHLFCLGTAA